MFSVEVTILNKGSLRKELESMRTWLDHKRVEPSLFRYVASERHFVVLRVDFGMEAEASDFALAFAGKLLR